MRVALITTKEWHRASRVGFHHLATAFARRGRDVVFVTVRRSRLGAWARRRRRRPLVAAPQADTAGSLDRVDSYLWRTLWHPANVRVAMLNRALAPLFRRYGRLPLGPIESRLSSADLLVFDSGSDLMLFDRLRALAPGARCVYRVSDDLRYAGVHPVVLEAEAQAAPRFHLISSPCAAIHARFARLPRARLDHHGVDRERFDRPCPSPFGGTSGPHAIFVGRHLLDRSALDALAERFPKASFHVIGSFEDLPRRPNVHALGELPYAATVPFIRHADVGLHTIGWRPGAHTFSDSLKVMQYTYCRLPIVAPAFLLSERPNVFAYEPGDGASLGRAFEAALGFDRAGLDVSGIRSWEELAASFED